MAIPIDELVNRTLVKLAEDQDAMLGARPSGDIDLVITPTNPISEKWDLRGTSAAGCGFLDRVWQRSHILNPKDLAKFKSQADAWGLRYHTDWSCVRTERIDP